MAAGAADLSASSSSSNLVSGVDVSHWQRNVNWQLVAEAGIQFAFIKSTDGLTNPDPFFTFNWERSRVSGLLRGAYHFFRPLEDPVQQAEMWLRKVGPQAGDLPPALDLEPSLHTDLTGKEVDQWDLIHYSERIPRVQAWLDRVQQSCGAKPVIYTSHSFWGRMMENSAAFTDYPLWVAEYTGNPEPIIPTGWSEWRFWQHSDAGAVNGIHGHVDLNRFKGSTTDLFAMTLPQAPPRQQQMQ